MEDLLSTSSTELPTMLIAPALKVYRLRQFFRNQNVHVVEYFEPLLPKVRAIICILPDDTTDMGRFQDWIDEQARVRLAPGCYQNFIYL